MLHFLLHWTGGDNGSGPQYLELSGFISLLGWGAAGWAWYKKSRCHIGGAGLRGCRKHGHYPFQHYKLCHKHHPDVKQNLTHLHIMKLHRAAK